MASDKCSACATVTNDVSKAIVKIEVKIRKSLTIIAIYVFVFVALGGITLFLLKSMYDLIRQWSTMASMNKANQVLTASSMAAVGDDEVYRSEAERHTETDPSYGDSIKSGMARLEAAYADYNAQITKYSRAVLNKPPEDLVNRGVLDRANDDFA